MSTIETQTLLALHYCEADETERGFWWHTKDRQNAQNLKKCLEGIAHSLNKRYKNYRINGTISFSVGNELTKDKRSVNISLVINRLNDELNDHEWQKLIDEILNLITKTTEKLNSFPHTETDKPPHIQVHQPAQSDLLHSSIDEHKNCILVDSVPDKDFTISMLSLSKSLKEGVDCTIGAQECQIDRIPEEIEDFVDGEDIQEVVYLHGVNKKKMIMNIEGCSGQNDVVRRERNVKFHISIRQDVLKALAEHEGPVKVLISTRVLGNKNAAPQMQINEVKKILERIPNELRPDDYADLFSDSIEQREEK